MVREKIGLLPALAALVLAACTTTSPSPPQKHPAQTPVRSYPGGGDCRMAGAQFAVGREATTALQNDAARRSGAQTVRILRPGQVITMEFSAQRLNLEVDASNHVVAVRCG